MVLCSTKYLQPRYDPQNKNGTMAKDASFTEKMYLRRVRALDKKRLRIVCIYRGHLLIRSRPRGFVHPWLALRSGVTRVRPKPSAYALVCPNE